MGSAGCTPGSVTTEETLPTVYESPEETGMSGREEIWVSYADVPVDPDLVENPPPKVNFDEKKLTPNQPFCPEDVVKAFGELGLNTLGDCADLIGANSYGAPASVNFIWASDYIWIDIYTQDPQDMNSCCLDVVLPKDAAFRMYSNGSIEELPDGWREWQVRRIRDLTVFGTNAPVFRGVTIGNTEEGVIAAFPVSKDYISGENVLYCDNYKLNPGRSSKDEGVAWDKHDRDQPYTNGVIYRNGAPWGEFWGTKAIKYQYYYEPPWEKDPHYGLSFSVYFCFGNSEDRVVGVSFSGYDGFASG